MPPRPDRSRATARQSPLRPLPLGDEASIREALPALASALDGSGAPLIPCAAEADPPAVPPATAGPAATELPPGLALVVATSGSTGIPKQVLLTGAALRASAHATAAALDGPGDWLLAIPPHHIGGLQVIIRSVLAGRAPTVMDRTHGFTPAAFADATARMPGGDHPAYVSLVPTQVTRLLRDARGRAALARFSAVLCGGAATPPSLRVAAAAAGVRLVATYGMTETCGGCVYDAIPLPTTHIHIDNDRHVVLGGPMVAAGYLGEPDLTADHFQTDADGLRWFRTDDLGALDDEGKLTITGRADDLINTGGVKVAPGPIEDALVRFVPGVCDAVVVGVPDIEWGQRVAAVITVSPGVRGPALVEIREVLRDILPGASLPHIVRVVTEVPMRGPGKPNRDAIRALLGSDDTSGRGTSGPDLGPRTTSRGQ